MTLPNGWEEKPLGQFFEFQSKSGRKAGEGSTSGKYKFFTSSDIQKKFIDTYDYDGEFLIFGTGGGASIHYCNDKFSTSTDCFTVKVKEGLRTKYAYYFMRASMHLLEAGFHGAGLKHVSKDHIKEMKVRFPTSTKTQDRIIALLEKAEQIKNWRKEANGLSKDYLNSVFNEMFGNPIRNTKKWDLKILPQFVSKNKNSMKRGPFGGSLKKEIFVNEGYLVYEQRHAIHNDFKFARYYINEEKYKELEMFKVEPGDLIISCSGVTLGRIAEIPLGAKKGIINQALLKITLDKDIMNNEFFKFIFRSPNMQSILFGISRGSGIPNFPSMDDVKSVKFIAPPIDLQNKFAKIAHKIYLLNDLQETSKTESDNLFDSLMQKAFRGEL